METRRKTETDKNEGDDLAMRLGRLGGRVVEIVERLPETKAGRHICDQLLRAGTAPGAHYSEARGAQSRDDFIHKIALAAKEARESLHWLRVVHSTDYLDRDSSAILEEANEIVAILFSSLHTARENHPQNRR